jgi:8-oxo-dGTP pyrophosphatase MutT (NUDIX family)
MTKPPPLPPLNLRDPGDAWVEGPNGKKYWGTFGAAGLLILHPGSGVLLQLRAEWSHQGGTWGIPGGALKKGEDAFTAAIRESQEEAGIPDNAARIVGHNVLDLGFWSYTTVLAIADEYFEPRITDLESAALEWVDPAKVEDRELHTGFAQAWPDLRARLEAELR